MRNNLIDVIRGVLIINIILIHTVFWSGTSYVPEWVRNLSLMLDVPGLFFISGWTLSYTGKSKNIFSRIWQIYLPYAITLALCWIILISYYNTPITFSDWSKWLLFQGESYNFPVLMGSVWFLPVFIELSIISPIIHKFIQKKQYGICLTILVFFLIVIASILNYHGSIYPLVFYLFFFILGYLSMDLKIGLKGFILAQIAIFITMFIVWLENRGNFSLQNNKFPPDVIYLIFSIPAIILILYAKNFEQSINEGQHGIQKFLKFAGKNSLFIYFGQGFGSSILYGLITKPIDHNIPWYIILPFAFMANLLISLTFALLIKVITNNTRKLTNTKILIKNN